MIKKLRGLQGAMLAVEGLSIEQLREMNIWIGERIIALESGQEPAPVAKGGSRGTEPVEERRIDGVIYRLLKVTCGTASCKCNRGEEHGPYWFAYWSEKGRTQSKYIGKVFAEVKQENE